MFQVHRSLFALHLRVILLRLLHPCHSALSRPFHLCVRLNLCVILPRRRRLVILLRSLRPCHCAQSPVSLAPQFFISTLCWYAKRINTTATLESSSCPPLFRQLFLFVSGFAIHHPNPPNPPNPIASVVFSLYFLVVFILFTYYVDVCISYKLTKYEKGDKTVHLFTH